MVVHIHDPELEAALIRRRRRTGTDKFDEVWEGVYVMAPIANDEHQDLAGELTSIFMIVIQWPGLGLVRPGVNVSDRRRDWKKNYRCPDVVVFLNGTTAVNCKTFWYGGPDLAVEIVSFGDRTLDKIPFYEKVGTRELLVIDRHPWALTLYRLQGGRLTEAGRSTPDDAHVLTSEVVPLMFQLRHGTDAPEIEVVQQDGSQRWTIRTHAPNSPQ